MFYRKDVGKLLIEKYLNDIIVLCTNNDSIFLIIAILCWHFEKTKPSKTK